MFLPAVYILVLSTVSALMQPDTDYKSNEKDSYAKTRTTRMVGSIVAAIIKGSTRIVTSDAYSVFMKTGGAQQAVKDFKLLKPKIVENHKVYKEGQIGSTAVELHLAYRDPIMIIKSWKRQPGGRRKQMVERRIVYVKNQQIIDLRKTEIDNRL